MFNHIVLVVMVWECLLGNNPFFVEVGSQVVINKFAPIVTAEYFDLFLCKGLILVNNQDNVPSGLPFMSQNLNKSITSGYISHIHHIFPPSTEST